MLLELYRDSIVPAFRKEFGVTNIMQVPRLSKVCVNVGFGNADKAFISTVSEDLALITGQKPCFTKARKSISNFKLREGTVVGCKVTLRGDRMYHFLERLINIALPRGRDFKGLNPKGFDGRGNFSFGIKEHIIFPEVNYTGMMRIYGMDVSITTTATSDKEAMYLLRAIGIPFVDR